MSKWKLYKEEIAGLVFLFVCLIYIALRYRQFWKSIPKLGDEPRKKKVMTLGKFDVNTGPLHHTGRHVGCQADRNVCCSLFSKTYITSHSSEITSFVTFLLLLFLFHLSNLTKQLVLHGYLIFFLKQTPATLKSLYMETLGEPSRTLALWWMWLQTFWSSMLR